MTPLATTSLPHRRPGRGLSTLGVVVVVCAALVLGAGCEASGGAQKQKPDEQLTEETNTAKYDAALDDADNMLSRRTAPQDVDDAPVGGRLRRMLSATPSNFNWITQNGAYVSELQTYISNQFAVRDPQNPTSWVPELAYKATVSDDGRSYTIHIREGVMWQIPAVDFSDGANDWLKERRELTADDCAFTFELISHPQTKAGAFKPYFQDLDSVEVVDRYTFKVTWKRKTSASKEFTLGMYPMPKWLYTRDRQGNKLPKSEVAANLHEHWANGLAVGTGPYRLIDVEPNKAVHLERNPLYWGPKPPIANIDYLLFNNWNQAFAKLRSGELDLAELPPPLYRDLVVNAKANSPFVTGELNHKVVDRPVYYYIGWNADGPFFGDKRVRRAMTHAFNRKAIIEKVLHGLGEMMDGPILPGHPGSDPSIEPLPFDLDKAAALLDEAGWTDSDGDGIRDKVIDGKRTSFIFTMTAYRKNTALAYLNIFRNDLRRIGVAMSVNPVDWPQMQRLMTARQFDAFTGGWAMGWSVDPFQIWHSSQADVPEGSNRVGFRNEQADKIIETLRSTLDQDKRTKLIRKFHGIIHEEQPYTFLYRMRTAYAWRPALQNVQFQPLRPADLSLPWYFEDQAAEPKEVTDATESQ